MLALLADVTAALFDIGRGGPLVLTATAGLGVFGAEAPNRAARCVGHDTAVPNAAGPTAARPGLVSADVMVQAGRRVPGPPGAHPSRSVREASARAAG